MPIDTSDTETWDDEDEAAARAYGSECEAEHGDEVDEHDRVTPRPTLGTLAAAQAHNAREYAELDALETAAWLDAAEREPLDGGPRGLVAREHEYVERSIVRNWNALDGGRRP